MGEGQGVGKKQKTKKQNKKITIMNQRSKFVN